LHFPTLVRKRTRRAIREALGVLVADGLVMQAAGSGYSPGVDSVPLSVILSNGSQTGAVSIPDSGPSFSGGSDDAIRWRLVRSADHPIQQLATSNLLDGLEDLLRSRGLQVLEAGATSLPWTCWRPRARRLGSPWAVP
jgi:hypothetical protein